MCFDVFLSLVEFFLVPKKFPIQASNKIAQLILPFRSLTFLNAITTWQRTCIMGVKFNSNA